MASPSPVTTDILLPDAQKPIHKLHLSEAPQPGSLLTVDDRTYTVLERRHRYHLRAGRYQLHRILLYVQVAASDRAQVDGRWILGDATCRFNARSELMRCAVNPMGPCQGCVHYRPIQNS
ncbi:MAG: DUF6464 family protein [Cyanobacteria bacterium P01_A01_bin.135]